MTACLCPACADDPAPTYTEAYRLQCEVNWVLAMKDKPTRRAYMAMVAGKRGEAAANVLSDALVRAWKTDSNE